MTTDASTIALEIVDETVGLARSASRTDLAERLQAARARLARPATVTCVVGEFKQGKSSLVNALLGQDVCPVDDDLATSAITVLHHAEQPAIVVHRREDGEAVAEQVDAAELRTYVTEGGNPDNELGVERVDIGLPNRLLEQGIALVDTPGMGGLGAGHAAATLAFLPYADGLLFVSDASAELTAPELEFLQRAVRACPTVVMCLTKTDLYPEWRRIAELDQGHLADAGIDIPVVAVSPAVRRAAVDHKDQALNRESGIPTLLDAIDRRIMRPAGVLARQRAVAASRNVLGQLRTLVDAELEAVTDPDRAGAARQRLEAAMERLEHLKGPGSRWSTVLGDRITDLSTQATQALRSGMRSVMQGLEEQLEGLRTSDDWEAFSRNVQTEVADVVATVFRTIADGADALQQELVDLLGEDLDLGGLDLDLGIDLDGLWRDRGDEGGGGVAGSVGQALQAMRGAQGGILMFGMMGRMLPAAAATLVASNPVLLGAGVLMGGKQLLDQRKRRLAQQRQEARLAAKQFLDDVQFQLTPKIADTIRGIQRQLRDDVSAQVTAMLRTTTEAARNAKAAAEADEDKRQQRAERLRDFSGRIDEAAGRLEALVAQASGGGGAR